MLIIINAVVYTGPMTEAPPGTDTQDRRAQILAAAAELFALRGFRGVSIGDLGASVGLTGPALYRHFRGKDAVLTEMLLDISTRLYDEGTRRVAAAPDPDAALDALVAWHATFALESPALITVYERELDHVPEPQRREIRRIQRAYVEEWVRVVRDVRPALAEDLARASVHAVFGLLNSTPHSATGLTRPVMAGLLQAMASAALRISLQTADEGGSLALLRVILRHGRPFGARRSTQAR
jgi:AcrR family transcriptional regulator